MVGLFLQQVFYNNHSWEDRAVFSFLPHEDREMGIKNYLVEGVSCAGKTSVCDELRRRGYHVVDGDNELAYWGDPKTGAPASGSAPEQRAWLWSVEKLRALVADHSRTVTFFCGGSRNSDAFLALLEGAFVLEIDLDTLNQRLASRPRDEWGGTASEGEAFARRQQATKEGLPKNGIASMPRRLFRPLSTPF